MRALLFMIFLILGLTNRSFGQKGDTNPLMLFFQNNYDSTVIYNTSSPWHPEPSYSIIAKKLDRVYFFTYKNPYDRTAGRTFPGELMQKFMREHDLYSATKPDTNRYFMPFAVRDGKPSNHWSAITSHGIWEAKEVVETPGGCDVYDGEELTFCLITAKQIKVLSYYDPEFYASCKTPNVHRQTAIRTKKEVEAAFNNYP